MTHEGQQPRQNLELVGYTIPPLPTFTPQNAMRYEELFNIDRGRALRWEKDTTPYAREIKDLQRKSNLDIVRRLLPEVLDEVNTRDFHIYIPFANANDIREGKSSVVNKPGERVLRGRLRDAANAGNVAVLHAVANARFRQVVHESISPVHREDFVYRQPVGEQAIINATGVVQERVEAELKSQRFLLFRESLLKEFSEGLNYPQGHQTWKSMLAAPTITQMLMQQRAQSSERVGVR